MKYFIRLLGFMAALAALAMPVSAQDQPADKRLAKIHDSLIEDYPNLSHVSAEEMNAALLGQEDVLLLDVRKETEYAVSHIDGALRVDPDISEEEFLRLYGDQAAGRTVVLYCSVGRRSSRLGDKVSAGLMEKGAVKVSNLEGGVFNWHNKTRPLVSGNHETDKVHPYNAWWSRLITRKDGIAYKATKDEKSP